MANYEVTDYSEKIISAENIRVLSQVDWTWPSEFFWSLWNSSYVEDCWVKANIWIFKDSHQERGDVGH